MFSVVNFVQQHLSYLRVPDALLVAAGRAPLQAQIQEASTGRRLVSSAVTESLRDVDRPGAEEVSALYALLCALLVIFAQNV